MSLTGNGSFCFEIDLSSPGAAEEQDEEVCLLEISDELPSSESKLSKQGQMSEKLSPNHGSGIISTLGWKPAIPRQRALEEEEAEVVIDDGIEEDYSSPSMTPAKAAAAAWVLFRFKRIARTILRRFLIYWAMSRFDTTNEESSILNTNQVSGDIISPKYTKSNHFKDSGVPSPTEHDDAWELLIDDEMVKWKYEVISRLSDTIREFIIKQGFLKWYAYVDQIKSNFQLSTSSKSNGIQYSLEGAEQQLDDISSLIQRLENVGKIELTDANFECDDELNHPKFVKRDKKKKHYATKSSTPPSQKVIVETHSRTSNDDGFLIEKDKDLRRVTFAPDVSTTPSTSLGQPSTVSDDCSTEKLAKKTSKTSSKNGKRHKHNEQNQLIPYQMEIEYAKREKVEQMRKKEMQRLKKMENERNQHLIAIKQAELIAIKESDACRAREIASQRVAWTKKLEGPQRNKPLPQQITTSRDISGQRHAARRVRSMKEDARSIALGIVEAELELEAAQHALTSTSDSSSRKRYEAAVRAAANRVRLAKIKASQAETGTRDDIQEDEVIIDGQVENQSSEQDSMFRTKSRLLRQLALAERKCERDEARRVKLLLRRASEQEKVYKSQFKQSIETRERLHPPVDSQRVTSAQCSAPFSLLQPMGVEKGERKHQRFPNIALLDLCSGHWKVRGGRSLRELNSIAAQYKKTLSHINDDNDHDEVAIEEVKEEEEEEGGDSTPPIVFLAISVDAEPLTARSNAPATWPFLRHFWIDAKSIGELEIGFVPNRVVCDSKQRKTLRWWDGTHGNVLQGPHGKSRGNGSHGLLLELEEFLLL